MPTVTIEDNTKDYWTNIRTMTSVTSESSVPSSGFIDLDYPLQLPEEVEIRFDAISTTGGPSSVIFSVWRLLGGKVDRIAVLTHDSADFFAPIPSVVRFDGGKLWVTSTFSGGTGPTVSTLVQCRVIK